MKEEPGVGSLVIKHHQSTHLELILALDDDSHCIGFPLPGTQGVGRLCRGHSYHNQGPRSGPGRLEGRGPGHTSLNMPCRHRSRLQCRNRCVHTQQGMGEGGATATHCISPCYCIPAPMRPLEEEPWPVMDGPISMHLSCDKQD